MIRFNAEGVEGLHDRPRSDRPAFLDEGQMTAFKALVLRGPNPERTFGWLGRHRRLSKDYECKVQTSETLIKIAAIRAMLNRLAPA